jgi:tRNA dimethylallyltransferase
MAPAPRRDPRLRQRLLDRAARRGTGTLHRLLKRLDPETAARLGPADRQRLVRALEVRIASGRPLSAVLRDEPFGAERYDAVKIGLTMDRQLLNARIDARVGAFFGAGLVAEVRRLLASGRPPSANAFKAIGYREVAAHLRGETSLEEAMALTRRNTRRYAKRQATWFRRETGVAWFPIDPASADPFAAPRVEAAAALAARGWVAWA